ncbi:hypothetical protein [Roseococcus pinisoli]|uniref:Uncharacterized protein n=1 Tax=Roseococcus pinisoli TaxID=2835040 RepID=A0ABS5QE86_9PROT|nr:hypothetical protein [Roseococcus pinisoli]MBS7811235.1 hypothetical protein [Roseococcus pinisoli]
MSVDAIRHIRLLQIERFLRPIETLAWVLAGIWLVIDIYLAIIENWLPDENISTAISRSGRYIIGPALTGVLGITVLFSFWVNTKKLPVSYFISLYVNFLLDIKEIGSTKNKLVGKAVFGREIVDLVDESLKSKVIDKAHDPRTLMAELSRDSARIAAGILRKSNMCLVIGTGISFVGLMFFYMVNINRNLEFVNIYTYIVSYIPSFSILFFIEFIALYFLRQHRTSMDEYRYFENIKRAREENLVILHMFTENKTITPTKDVLMAMTIYSNAGKLGKDETTDLIEARKLQKDEMVLIEKIIESLSLLRRGGSQSRT